MDQEVKDLFEVAALEQQVVDGSQSILVVISHKGFDEKAKLGIFGIVLLDTASEQGSRLKVLGLDESLDLLKTEFDDRE